MITGTKIRQCLSPPTPAFLRSRASLGKPGRNAIARLTWTITPYTVSVFTAGFSRNQWRFGVQREVPGRIAHSAAYAGNHAVHLDRTNNLNQRQPSAAVAGGKVNVNTVRPSKAIVWGVGQNNITQPDEEGLSSYDQPQYLTINYVYELPFFRHSNAFISRIFGGWKPAVTRRSQVASHSQSQFPDIFNHPNFSWVGNVFGSPTYGDVTAALGPRHTQITAKLTF